MDSNAGDAGEKLLWKFAAVLPQPEELGNLVLRVPTLTLAADSKISFEKFCRDLEHEFTRTDYGLVCECCESAHPCSSCRFAVGFHACARAGEGRQWYRKGTLFNGALDVQRLLFDLQRKGLPLDKKKPNQICLRDKIQEYVEGEHITSRQAEEMLAIMAEQQHDISVVNELQPNDESSGTAPAAQGERAGRRLSTEELRLALAQREENLRRPTQTTGTGSTDQWRIYSEICSLVQEDRDAAMFIQASAGGGKSYLLETVCLWCIVHKIPFKACAPTGIAAANVSIDGTDVTAATMHSLFGLDEEMGTTLDFTQTREPKVRALLDMRVLLIDEHSMMDVDCWNTIKNILAEIRSRRPGPVHVLMFGDLKQLPPATSKAPFIVDPAVHNTFAIRVLRENRRVVADEARREELENYHNVLDDMGHGRASLRVKRFLIDAYVRAALEKTQTATRVPLEGYTSIFTKRRHRDRWNRAVVNRIIRDGKRKLKVKGIVVNRHAATNRCFRTATAELIRRKARTLSLWNLTLAGDWHPDYETRVFRSSPHEMRVMLLANIDVDQRFANGTQGRAIFWEPGNLSGRAPLRATHGEVSVRFAKESSRRKPTMAYGFDHIDVKPRRETIVSARGRPALLQIPVGPAYALSVHKSQSLTIPHVSQGCLEGVFAAGQCYTQTSRATDPRKYQAIGLPPADLLDDVAAAVQAAKLDVNTFFHNACSVTNEWLYMDALPGQNPVVNVRTRLRTRAEQGWASKIILRTTETILRPQEQAADVFLALLAWMDAADVASQRGETPPPFRREDGNPMFPPDRWWLTDAQQQDTTSAIPQAIDGDGPDFEEDADPEGQEDEEDWLEDATSNDGSELVCLGEDAPPPPCATFATTRSFAAGVESSFDARPMWRKRVGEASKAVKCFREMFSWDVFVGCFRGMFS